VLNPLDPPPRWEVGYLELGQNEGKQVPAYFGADAFYVESPDPKQNYLYAYGVYCSDWGRFFNTFQVLGIRIPLDKLKAATDGTDLGPFTEVMAKKYGTWRSWPVVPDDFYEIGSRPNFAPQSFSTRYNRTLGSWQVTFARDQDIEAGKYGSNDPKGRTVFVAKGAGPFGPWEKPVAAFTFPEAALPTPTPGVQPPERGQRPPDPHEIPDRPPGGIFYGKLFSYFALEVPALEANDQTLAISYSTDSTRDDVDRFWNLGVYTVRVAREIPNPLLKKHDPK
jgi:hypothetical protein